MRNFDAKAAKFGMNQLKIICIQGMGRNCK